MFGCRQAVPLAFPDKPLETQAKPVSTFLLKGFIAMNVWFRCLTVSIAIVLVAGAFWAGQNSNGEEKKVTGRIYELRTYTTLDGRLPALHKRFREHTIKLFEKHGMKNGMYWIPTDPALSENTLIYVVSHDSEEAAKKSWDAFRKDPEWVKVRDASEADGKIVKEVKSVYMQLTDYSPVK